jgi:GST-like protein
VIELVYVANPIARALTILLAESTLEYRPFSPGYGTAGLYVPPLLLDDEPFSGAGRVEISHPGAAMVYLAEKARSMGKAGAFYPEDPKQAFAAEQWVMWQTVRQAFCPPSELSQNRERANQLFQQLNIWLDGRDYIAGNHYSIADMMCYPWVVNWGGQEPDLQNFGNLQRWFFERLSPRPAVHSGMQHGSATPTATDPLERALRYNYLAGDPTTRLP